MLICPSSPPTQTAAFRSQRISAPDASFNPPLLQQPAGLTKIPAAIKSPLAQDDSLPLSLAQKKEAIGSIPVIHSYHILERTAIQISEDTLTVSKLLDRILQYMKLNSIGYECEPDTGCLECSSPNMIGFVVQLWRARVDNSTNTDGKKIWVEVQRRQGCAIAMNAIRRSLVRHVKGGDPEPPAVAAGRRRPLSDCDSHHRHHHRGNNSNKRQRSLSPHAARLNCQDALVISLRLLENSQADQQKLGLESLNVLTDRRLVSEQDATIASRTLILGEGQVGPQLQQRLAAILREVQPTLGNSGFGHNPCHASTCAMFYHITLHALANALDQVSRDTMAPRMDLNTQFWQTASACLLTSLEDAMRRPHEATLSAKCLRFLLPSDRLHIPTMQTALRKNHELGRAHNLSLEEESRKTLRFL